MLLLLRSKPRGAQHCIKANPTDSNTQTPAVLEVQSVRSQTGDLAKALCHLTHRTHPTS